ncbi:hypothetical protein A3D66_00755 [Candidatus Kaiserbacteria bacterium RIFCSPHIGHO2_02_FULL_50_9]|uniref:Uncharacterized protein n=1 Tax=Candidatus Kaiserbacteria bacterium RIFCSPLOWO2_01_FULL_51_21 TaxID=1798508 RepID=A0A1F6EEE1_9BACT|nr:MAG: hypothetical protein A2761_00815 [Candidatus Kaiserbacteria bacterium RIFCSPHIGHO2_01_FULL_51_33]OGG63544.1 MAG: hypothetical protein A3D66_00755 [Candidatus Kaiserbacteria bacterium RIFCSPHIGHO2_02_FULL_50_9]OGG71582.1 MAG: hypothetical protein A3A35_02900 [Candidatus Kaiserbacteria bacterium RIFCSPLOWO2_01_FULL_51_21]
MEFFIQRFLQARDGNMPPQEAWLSHEGPNEKFMASFAAPLELLDQEAWDNMLLIAVKTGAVRAYLSFRYGCTFAEARQLSDAYLTSYLLPLNRKRVIGVVTAGLYDASPWGWYFISLFDYRDIPRSHRTHTQSQFEALLRDVGYDLAELEQKKPH